MTYAEARQYIESLKTRGWRLGLDRMRELMARLGNPQDGLKFFHVAGTNGKGTTTALIAKLLQSRNLNTGAYYSPYVYSFRERIQLNGEHISKEDVARLTQKIIPISEALDNTHFGGPTEFEFKTAMGFCYWAERNCDYVALEVGLGGRLDATNVIAPPACAVITEIGLDHQQFLGNTLEAIAGEKAGILKPGSPAISGVTDAGAAAVIRKQCPCVWQLGDEFNVESSADGIVISLNGRKLSLRNPNSLMPRLPRNIAIAFASLERAGLPISEDDCAEAFANGFELPGRAECLSERVVGDGAHNPQAISALAETLEPAAVVYSAATGHELRASLSAAARLSARLYVAPMRHPRAANAEELHRVADEVGATFCGSVNEALRRALDETNGLVLATGSFYLLAEAKAALARSASFRA